MNPFLRATVPSFRNDDFNAYLKDKMLEESTIEAKVKLIKHLVAKIIVAIPTIFVNISMKSSGVGGGETMQDMLTKVGVGGRVQSSHRVRDAGLM